MTARHGSLLALDAFASDESVRVAIYGRAVALLKVMANPPKVELVAERLVSFVKNERWRFDALDIALEHATRRTTIDELLAEAAVIIRWAKPVLPPSPVQAPDPAPEKPVTVTRKKMGRRR